MRISDWSSDVCSSDLSWWLALDARGCLDRRRRQLRRASRLGLRRGIPHRWGSPSLMAGSAVTQAGADVAHMLGRRAERDAVDHRSEERLVGKECVSTCRSRLSPYYLKTKTTIP